MVIYLWINHIFNASLGSDLFSREEYQENEKAKEEYKAEERKKKEDLVDERRLEEEQFRYVRSVLSWINVIRKKIILKDKRKDWKVTYLNSTIKPQLRERKEKSKQ